MPSDSQAIAIIGGGFSFGSLSQDLRWWRSKVLISHHRNDETWKDLLVHQLQDLEEKGVLEVWDNLSLGADLLLGIKLALARAKVAVLLVSAEFLSSELIWRNEVPQFLEQRRTEGLVVITLIVRPCAWETVPWLSSIRCRPQNGRPLSRLSKYELEECLAALAQEIRQHLGTVAEPPRPDIQPQRLGPGEKPAEVFLSYAWGDEEELRTKAATGLYRALAEHGFQPVRDRDQIRPGESISAFIRRLTRADLVVAVISDKYLRSYYCMYEIYRLWQRFQGNRDELARHVVPIVLPEVQVGSLKARAPYLTYWNEQKEEHDALRRKLDLSLSAEDWDEIRLVHEFSHHVAQILGFLNDVLMPRMLEAHLDDGFEAVREALGRRLRER